MTKRASGRTLAAATAGGHRVGEEDMLSRALGAAYDLHRHRETATFAAALVRALARAVPCDSALLVTVDPATTQFRLDTWPVDQFAHLDREQVTRLHAAEHPFVALCRTSRSARALRLVDLAKKEDFARTGLYANLYRFLGIEHQLLMLVASPDARWRGGAQSPRARIQRRGARGARSRSGRTSRSRSATCAGACARAPRRSRKARPRKLPASS